MICHLPLNGISVPIHLHYFWPVVIIAMSMTGFSVSFLHGIYALIISGPVLFCTVLIHEMCHGAMAISCGGTVKRILLWPLGGVAYISMFGQRNPKADALIAIAGPLSHIPQVLFWGLLFFLFNNGSLQWSFGGLTWGTLWVHVCAGAISTQIALCLFNLLPAFPLDGGRLLSAFLASRKVEEHQSHRITGIVGGSIGVVLFLQSLRSVMPGGQQTLYLGWTSLAISFFILTHCWQLFKAGVQLRAPDVFESNNNNNTNNNHPPSHYPPSLFSTAAPAPIAAARPFSYGSSDTASSSAVRVPAGRKGPVIAQADSAESPPQRISEAEKAKIRYERVQRLGGK